jgi:hypothetical protein
MSFARKAIAAGIVASAMLFAGCQDDGSPISTIDEIPDAGCARTAIPKTFQVYFVIDVSGSMAPFLMDLRNQLVSFVDGFPKLDSEGRPVRVDYYVIAFVNDVKQYGGRMTSVIALQGALDEAIERGQTNLNLMQNKVNAEPEENTLDALAKVIEMEPSAEVRLVMIAGDATIPEAPAILSENIEVKSNYATILSELTRIEANIHAFVPDELDGLSRTFEGMPALTSLPGSTVNSLRDLTGANDRIRETLTKIASGASCN